TACGKQRPDHAHSRPRCLLLIALLVAPFATEAEEGEEFVLLSSGNRMTGTVRALDRGELTFTIDGAGTVDIDWKNVETLQSEQRFDVELASGERLAGSIVAGAPGDLPAFFGPSITWRTVLPGSVVDGWFNRLQRNAVSRPARAGRSSGSELGRDCDTFRLNSSGVSWPRLE